MQRRNMGLAEVPMGNFSRACLGARSGYQRAGIGSTKSQTWLHSATSGLLRSRQGDAKAELLDKCIHVFSISKTRTAYFPIRHANQNPQKIEGPNLKFLRGLVLDR
jgi:hypothetical protein